MPPLRARLSARPLGVKGLQCERYYLRKMEPSFADVGSCLCGREDMGKTFVSESEFYNSDFIMANHYILFKRYRKNTALLTKVGS